MVDIGRDDHAPASDFIADELSRRLLLEGDELHLFGDYAFAREMHLRHIAVAGARGVSLTVRNPFRTRSGYLGTLIFRISMVRGRGMIAIAAHVVQFSLSINP